MVQKKKNSKKPNSDSEDDETLYYRYPSTSTTPNPNNPPPPKPKSNGSGGLAPSKSTVYVSNLDYNLTNSDLHTLFSTFGKVARVTVLKDRATRRSRGVAFVLFVSRHDAAAAAAATNGKVLNNRTLSASIAADNGRAPEFIKKRVYRDKSRCYECGVEGHLSYECPRNLLGKRERPVVKRGRRGGGGGGGGEEVVEEEEVVGVEEEESWAAVVDGGADERLLMGEGGGGGGKKGKRERRVSYFSDESDEEE